jgi:antitoxin StbD
MTISTTEARTSLSQTLARFRVEGAASEPIIFGDHRKPEGVVLPFELYAQLEDQIDQVRFELATKVISRIEEIIANPSKAVKVERHRN